MFHYKAIAFAGVVLVGSADSEEYGNEYMQSYDYDGYGHHGKGDYQYGYEQPGHYDNYEQGYNNHGYHGGYHAKKHYDRKDMTIVDPKAFFYLMSSFEQCKKHKCEQYGYDNYEYSDDYKTMLSSVGEYVSCNMACGAATLVKASCKMAEDVNKVYQIAKHQLEYVSGKVEDEKIRDMHLKIGESCILAESEFVDYTYITGTFNNIVDGIDYHLSLDQLRERCHNQHSREVLAFEAAGIPKKICTDDVKHTLNRLHRNAGKNVLSEHCGYRDNTCSQVLQSNPRSSQISQSTLCQPKHFRMRVVDTTKSEGDYGYVQDHVGLDLGDVVLGIQSAECDMIESDVTNKIVAKKTFITKKELKHLTKAYEDCEEADRITHLVSQYATYNKKKETWKLHKDLAFDFQMPFRKMHTRDRFLQINDNLPSKVKAVPEIDSHLAQVTSDIKMKEYTDNIANAENSFASDFCEYDESLTEDVKNLDIGADMIKALGKEKCVAGKNGYEFQRLEQWKDVVAESLTDDHGCKIEYLSDKAHLEPSMTSTLVCAKRIADMKCQCMNAVINCFQQNGYKDSNAVTQTVGKVAALLCAQFLCMSPMNFAQMSGLGAFRAAKVMKVILAQANLASDPSMSSLPPASFAFLAFGMGMFAFVVTQAVLKKRRRSVSESGSTKSLLAAQSTL